MNLYQPDAIEVRMGRAHFAAVRGRQAEKVRKGEVRDALRAEIDAAAAEIAAETARRRGMADGRARFAGVVRHRDAVRGVARQSEAADTADREIADRAVAATLREFRAGARQ